MLEYFCKKTRETLDYTIDFNRFLIGRESITGASAVITAPVVTDADETLQVSRVGFTKSQVAVWLIGGEEGIEYTVTVTIDTDQGRRKEHNFFIRTTGEALPIAQIGIADTAAIVGFLQ